MKEPAAAHKRRSEGGRCVTRLTFDGVTTLAGYCAPAKRSRIRPVVELRLVHDRRHQARGGRREGDHGGYAPMIVVIDDDATRLDISEAILAKLRFAVAPFASVDQALAAMQALRPEIIVVRESAVQQLRGRVPADKDGRAIPLLPVTPELSDPEALVEALRELIREHRQQTAL